MMRAEVEPDDGQLGDDRRADLDQLGADRRTGRLRQRGAGRRQAPERFHQQIGQRRQQQPPLVGPPPMRTDPVGEQHHLFFDPVFHLPALAVAPIIDPLRVAHDVGQDETRVAALVGVFGLRDDPTHPALAGDGVIEGRRQSQ